MFGNLGMTELLMIMVIVLVLFGAKRIPEMAGSIGKGIREFKRSVSNMDEMVTAGSVEDVRRRQDVETAHTNEEPSEPKRLVG